MAFNLVRNAPRLTSLLLNIVAVILLGVALTSDWATGDISAASSAGQNTESTWTLEKYELGGGVQSIKWPDIFKFYDEGSNKCSDTFTSDGGLASVANSNLSVTINSCTSTRGDIDQVDTVARLVYLSLAFTAVAFACTLSVLVLSMQDAEPDLQLAAVYAVFLDLLGASLTISSVAIFSSVLTRLEDSHATDFVAMSSIFLNPTAQSFVTAAALADAKVDMSTAAGFDLTVVAAVLSSIAAIAAVYELYLIRAEAAAEEEERERAAAEEAAKKERLRLKNEKAAQEQEERANALSGSTRALDVGGAASSKKDD